MRLQNGRFRLDEHNHHPTTKQFAYFLEAIPLDLDGRILENIALCLEV